MDTLHIDTIKQKVADHLLEDNHSKSWTIGPNHHPGHDNVIYWHCKNRFALGDKERSFEYSTVADINTILDLCYRSDIEMFAADEGIIDIEEIA